MKPEQRKLPAEQAEIRATFTDDSIKITGYAAVYYNKSDPGTEFRMNIGPDGVYERIMPGAFDRAIAEQDFPALFNHDANQILGRKSAGTLTVESDQKGLKYTIRAAPTSVAKDVALWARNGDLGGSSFRFNVPDGGDTFEKGKDGKMVRQVTQVDVLDVGPVTDPAYNATTAEAAGALRDVSRAYAKYVIATAPDKK